VEPLAFCQTAEGNQLSIGRLQVSTGLDLKILNVSIEIDKLSGIDQHYRLEISHRMVSRPYDPMQEIQFVVGYPTSREERLKSFSTVQSNASRLRWRKSKSAAKSQSSSTESRQPKNRPKGNHNAHESNTPRSASGEGTFGDQTVFEKRKKPKAAFAPTLDSRLLPPVLPVQCTDLVKNSDLHFMLHNCQ
jgi:hypothetical protein